MNMREFFSEKCDWGGRLPSYPRIYHLAACSALVSGCVGALTTTLATVFGVLASKQEAEAQAKPFWITMGVFLTLTIVAIGFLLLSALLPCLLKSIRNPVRGQELTTGLAYISHDQL